MNLLAYFKLRYCRAHMLAYLSGELSPRARARIARYIDESAACYAEYVRQRDASRDLSRRLAFIGQPDKPQLDRVWLAIQGEMSGEHRPRRRPLTPRYGLAGMALMFVLLMPFTMPSTTASPTVPSQPPPHTITQTAVAVIMVTQETVSRATVSVTPQAAVTPFATPGTPELVMSSE